MWSKLVCIAIITNMIWSQLGVAYASTSHVVKTGVYSNNYKHDLVPTTVVYASTSHVVETGVYSNNYKHDLVPTRYGVH